MISKLTGWGRSNHSISTLKTISSEGKMEILSNCINERGIIPRGLARSYGDSAMNSGGITLQTQAMDKIQLDPESGTAVIGGGASLMQLERICIPLGFFPFVVPGTSRITIGGAIASDIHGKSHHNEGSFSNHLLEMKLLASDGTVRILKPNGESSKLFWATVGGMGLTGIIIEATIRLKKIETSFVEINERRVNDLDQLLSVLTKYNKEYLYTVAWLDISGKYAGRGVVSGANHLKLENLPESSRAKNPLGLKTFGVKFPSFFVIKVITRTTIGVFNFCWFWKPLGKKIQQIQAYMHPLDFVENWNLLYGKKGFMQYQFVIPFEAKDVLHDVLKEFQKLRINSFLAVLKSFGEGSSGFLSFPKSGWTLAVDLPLGDPRISSLVQTLDRMVLEAGGRLYLTKDSRMSHCDLPLMYPELDVWKEIKKECDPNNLWQSDQGRRLKLC